jgi:hypothetical protein
MVCARVGRRMALRAITHNATDFPESNRSIIFEEFESSIRLFHKLATGVSENTPTANSPFWVMEILRT